MQRKKDVSKYYISNKRIIKTKKFTDYTSTSTDATELIIARYRFKTLTFTVAVDNFGQCLHKNADAY